MNCFYHRASFLKSSAKVNQLPADEGYEVAFAGRSNAGKSSALNVLTDNKKLARISKTPGRTQLINLFELDAERRLVDLPGYGFAKVPKAMKKAWEATMSAYLIERQSLRGVILLVDIRHPMKSFDQQMIEWAYNSEMPLHILLSKADKLSRGAASAAVQALRKELTPVRNFVSCQSFSSLKKAGLDELIEVLNHWYQLEQGADDA